jgi:hypothetical protein
MVSRFQIEDMVAQDISGVVFRAMDLETGLPVAVRRFFPFGVNGGGLSQDEQIDYDTAVGRLMDIRHPAMRAIIYGGCDPVDGMPFIATEWIEGSAIQIYLGRAPLSAAETIHLVSQALEVCERISEVFGREAVWVETDVHTIIVGAEGSGRGVTFWMSPLKWLGKTDGQRGLDAIVTLTEDVMGWTGKTILDSDGGGLGGWLKWLRSSARKATLVEARERLLGISNLANPAPVKRAVRQAAPPARIKPPKRKSNLAFVFGGIAALVLISTGGWALIRWNNARLGVIPAMEPVEIVEAKPTPPKRSSKTPPKEEKPDELASTSTRDPQPRLTRRTPEQISQAAADLLVSAQQADRSKAAASAARDAEIASRNGIFTPEDSELLLAMSGEEVTVRGILRGFKYSNSRATQYLVFSDNPATGEIRGSVLLRTAPAGIKEDQLSSLKGKEISLRGKIRIENFGKTPVISIQSRDVIQEIK